MTSNFEGAQTVRAFAPGRVNLIGDHTDYVGGLVLPMAIQLGTTATFERGGSALAVTSRNRGGAATLKIPFEDRPSEVKLPWARYVAGVVSELDYVEGGSLHIDSTLPLGAGLSSSASLQAATALALGFQGSPKQLAQLSQRAEQVASGVPCGIMDQLAISMGKPGHAILIDCQSLETKSVRVPDGIRVFAIHSGVHRRLEGSEYADRRGDCEAAAAIVGPLRDASLDDLSSIADPRVRRRARHVITENQRVRDFVTLLNTGNTSDIGQLLTESHNSLADDMDVSIPEVDELVAKLSTIDGVLGARITGAGFGGCVVAVCEQSVDDALIDGWELYPAAAAALQGVD